MRQQLGGCLTCTMVGCCNCSPGQARPRLVILIFQYKSLGNSATLQARVLDSCCNWFSTANQAGATAAWSEAANAACSCTHWKM